MRCPHCDKSVLKELKYDNWIKLMNFIQFLELNGDITSELSATMTDSLMSFKLYACQPDMPKDNYIEEIKDLIEGANGQGYRVLTSVLKSKETKEGYHLEEIIPDDMVIVKEVCNSCEKSDEI